MRGRAWGDAAARVSRGPRPHLHGLIDLQPQGRPGPGTPEAAERQLAAPGGWEAGVCSWALAAAVLTRTEPLEGHKSAWHSAPEVPGHS